MANLNQSIEKILPSAVPIGMMHALNIMRRSFSVTACFPRNIAHARWGDEFSVLQSCLDSSFIVWTKLANSTAKLQVHKRLTQNEALVANIIQYLS